MKAVESRLLVLAALCVLMLTGCPRFAYIDAYNNTGQSLEIIESGVSHFAEQGERVTFRFGSDSFVVRSSFGVWVYDRQIPHSGETGEYFDGTLRLQIEPDGLIYALGLEQEAPTHVPFQQPEGFPLSPREVSTRGRSLN
jgi:hypothetical protein